MNNGEWALYPLTKAAPFNWAMGRQGASLTSPSPVGPGEAVTPGAHAEHPTAEGQMSLRARGLDPAERRILFSSAQRTPSTEKHHTEFIFVLRKPGQGAVCSSVVASLTSALLTRTLRMMCQEETTQTHPKMQSQATEGGATARQLTEAFCYTAGLARSGEHLA